MNETRMKMTSPEYNFENFEITEEKNKEIQFLNYFYYVAWNSIRYGADIYRNIKKFFPDSYSLRA